MRSAPLISPWMAKNARHPKTQAAPRGRILTYPKEKMDQGMGSLTRRRGISVVQFDTRSQMKIMAQKIQFILPFKFDNTS
jgi:hypothetical protein